MFCHRDAFSFIHGTLLLYVKPFIITQLFPLFQVNLLLLHQAIPTSLNKDKKSPLDLACEFGRYRVSKGILIVCVLVLANIAQLRKNKQAKETKNNINVLETWVLFGDCRRPYHMKNIMFIFFFFEKTTLFYSIN